jgi:glycosyltransferase involved in cell wall biosynthesis
VGKVNVLFIHRKPHQFHWSIEKLFADIRTALPNDIDYQIWECPHESQGFKARLANVFAARQKTKNFDGVYHITGDVHYLALGLKKKRTILTIHDLGFMRHPNPLARWILWFFWIWLPVRRAGWITTISEATKRDIVRYAKCSPNKIRVIPNCISSDFIFSKKEFNAEKPIILQIGTKFNKNLERLIPALKGIVCHLRIIGKLSENQEQLLQIHKIEYSSTHGLSDLELREEYQKADIISFCSTLEGFGLPILEAQAIGCVVVTSNCSSMPEVAGKGACLVDPYQITAISEGIKKVIIDDKYREMLIREGRENVNKYSSDYVAGIYNTLYQKVLQNQ